MSHGGPGAASLMGKIAPTDTKLPILWAVGFVNPDLVRVPCTMPWVTLGRGANKG